jgi:hypothetical protein
MNLNMITLYQRSKGPPEPTYNKPNNSNNCNGCFNSKGCKDGKDGRKYKYGCEDCCNGLVSESPGLTIDGGVYIMIIIAILVGSLLTIKYRRK